MNVLNQTHRRMLQGALVVGISVVISACNFVDPGVKTVVEFTDTEIRLPIYQAGDYLEYAIQGARETSDGTFLNQSGSLKITYLSGSGTGFLVDPLPQQVLNANPDLASATLLQEVMTLDFGGQITKVRYIKQISDPDNPNYGAKYLIGLYNSTNNAYSLPGNSNSLEPVLLEAPVVFNQVPANNLLPPIGFGLYIDCQTTSCVNEWLQYDEVLSLSKVNHEFFYGETTYKTASIHKSAWHTSQQEPYASSAATQAFYVTNVDFPVFCADTSSSSFSNGSGLYHYLNPIGVVAMTDITCKNSTSLVAYSFNFVELINGRVGGVNIENLL